MFIGNWVEVKFISPNDKECLFGLYNQICDGYPLDDNDEPDFSEEPIQVGRFSIGLIILTINIYYR